MALTGPAITTAILASRVAGIFPLLGVSFNQVALAIGSAFQLWGIGQPQNLALVGGTSGLTGVGVILPPTSKVVIPPDPLTIIAGLTSVGVVGPTSSSVATAVAVGLSSAINSFAQYTGPSAGVGVGADLSKIAIVNTATLTPIMASTFLSMVGPGPVAQQLAAGLSIGISNFLYLGAGTGLVSPIPPPAPPPVPPAVLGVTGPSAVV